MLYKELNFPVADPDGGRNRKFPPPLCLGTPKQKTIIFQPKYGLNRVI